ncbi:MAG: hypothetical protein FK730_14395 [Asgard group archaeon]|nr:hypothetical protein [Asgard group archaeon]
MSGYIHTIGFKVLVDREVIDFSFRVPRGTLLVQILDELETTLRIQPRIISSISNTGEIITIENHYSTIDFLVQKHGTEYFAGEISVVTFNHGEYIVDLEVPEAIPFAATYRTACKSFSLKTREVAIERQDGQIIDYEVFSRPTAFVLNSWGSFYRIVDKELGDVLVEPPKEEITPEVPIKAYEQMIYPPKMEDTKTEIEQMTENYIDATTDQQEDDELFITEPIKDEEEKPVLYPWERERILDLEEKVVEHDDVPAEESIESLMDNLTIEDEVLKAETDKIIGEIDEVEKDEEIEPIIDELPVKKEVIEEVFRGIFEEERREKSIRESPLESIEEDPIIKDDSEVLAFDDEIEIEDEPISYEQDEELIDSYDLPTITEEEELFEEESITELPEVEDEIVDIHSEIDVQEEIIDLQTEDLDATEVDEGFEIKPLIEEESLTDSTPPIVEQPVMDEIAEPSFVSLDDKLTLDERLEKRKKELATLEMALKAQEENGQKVDQRSINIEYFIRMYPQKIFPLKIKILPIENSTNTKTREIKIQPIFPGCLVMPTEEYVDLIAGKLTAAEFNITPLIRRGKIAGKINLWHNKHNILSVNTSSKVINTFWTYFTGFIAFLFGLLPIVLEYIAQTNTRLAVIMSFTAQGLLWIEVAILVVFAIITISLAFGLRPSKKLTNRKFYPIILDNEEV